MARAHQAYKEKHGINCNPEILMTPPAVAEFLLPELHSEMAASAVVAGVNKSHHGRRLCGARRESESEPAAGAAAAPTQTWRKRLRLRPLKRLSVKLSVSAPAKTRPKAKDMAAMLKVRARVKAIAEKRHTAKA